MHHYFADRNGKRDSAIKKMTGGEVAYQPEQKGI
jgi:hypothetical protein